MTDTHESMQAQFYKMMMDRAPLERLRMGCSMFDTAKRIVRSSILQANPKSSVKEIKKGIFLRFYSEDFKLDLRNKILNSLK